eukprot:g37176.t1
MTVVHLSYQDSKNLDNRWLVLYMPDSCAPQEEGAGEASSEALLIFAHEAKAHIIIPEFKEPISSAVEKARTAVGLPLLLVSTVTLLFSAQHFNLLLEVDPEDVAGLSVLSYPTALIEEANISKQSFEDQSCKVCGFPPFGDDNFLGEEARGPHAACAAAALQAPRHAETQGSRKRPSHWDVCNATIIPTEADNANAVTAPADASLIFPCVNASARAPERAVAATEDGSINPVARPAAAAVALDAACSEAGRQPPCRPPPQQTKAWRLKRNFASAIDAKDVEALCSPGTWTVGDIIEWFMSTLEEEGREKRSLLIGPGQAYQITDGHANAAKGLQRSVGNAESYDHVLAPLWIAQSHWACLILTTSLQHEGPGDQHGLLPLLHSRATRKLPLIMVLDSKPCYTAAQGFKTAEVTARWIAALRQVDFLDAGETHIGYVDIPVPGQTDSDCGIHTMMHIQRFVRNPTSFLGHESGSMTTWERLHPRTIEEDILRGRNHLHEKLTGVHFQEHAAESPTTSSAESGTEPQTELDITGSDCDSEAEPDQHMAVAEQALAVAHAATTPQPPSTESGTEPQTKLDITESDCDSEAEPDQHMAAAEQALAVAHAATTPQPPSTESGTEPQTKLDITGSDCDSEAKPDHAEQALAVAHAATTPQPPSTESGTEPQTKLDITGSDCDSEAEPDQHMAAVEQALAVAHAATTRQPPSTESGTELQTKLDITGSDCDSEAKPDQHMSCTLPGRLYLAFTDQAGLMYTYTVGYIEYSYHVHSWHLEARELAEKHVQGYVPTARDIDKLLQMHQLHLEYMIRHCQKGPEEICPCPAKNKEQADCRLFWVPPGSPRNLPDASTDSGTDMEGATKDNVMETTCRNTNTDSVAEESEDTVDRNHQSQPAATPTPSTAETLDVQEVHAATVQAQDKDIRCKSLLHRFAPAKSPSPPRLLLLLLVSVQPDLATRTPSHNAKQQRIAKSCRFIMQKKTRMPRAS